MATPTAQDVVDSPEAALRSYRVSRQRLLQWIGKNELERRGEQRKELIEWVLASLASDSDVSDSDNTRSVES